MFINMLYSVLKTTTTLIQNSKCRKVAAKLKESHRIKLSIAFLVHATLGHADLVR